MEGQVQKDNYLGIEKLKDRLEDVMSISDSAERIEALETLIAHCALPLENKEALSEDYSAFLTNLCRLQMIEEARKRLAALTT